MHVVDNSNIAETAPIAVMINRHEDFLSKHREVYIRDKLLIVCTDLEPLFELCLMLCLLLFDLVL